MTFAEQAWNFLMSVGGGGRSFYDTGLMDVVRSLIVLLLACGVWNVSIPGIDRRPFRNFVLWGIEYPFPSFVMILLGLILWGIVGADYGLQDLFFENASLQLQLGMATSLSILAMIFHCYVAYNSATNWGRLVENTIDAAVQLDRWAPNCHPFRLLRDGFLEYLRPGDFALIQRAVEEEKERRRSGAVPYSGDAPSREIARVFQTDSLVRLLFAPAVLLTTAFYVVVLLGFIPFLLEDSRTPWLLGTIFGAVAAVAVACWSTRRLSIAVGDHGPTHRRSRSAAALLRRLERSRTSAAMPAAAAPPPAAPPAGRRGGPDWAGWMKRTSVAFLIAHVFVCGFAAWYAPWITSRSAKPEPWALATLAAELALAAAAAALVGRSSRPSWRGNPLAWLAAYPRVVIALIVLTGLTVLMILSPAVPQLEPRSTALLVAFLASWFIPFALATSRNLRGLSGDTQTRWILGISLAATAAGILCWSGAAYRSAEFLGIVAVAFPLYQIVSVMRRAHLRSIPNILAWTAFVVIPAVALAVYWGSGTTLRQGSAYTTSVILMLAISAIAVLMLSAILGDPDLGPPGAPPAAPPRPGTPDHSWRGVLSAMLGRPYAPRPSRSPDDTWRRFALVYPLSVIFAFAAFAVLFDGLDEADQAFLPAGASLLALLGLLSAACMATRAAGHRRQNVLIAGLLFGLLILNGNAWLFDPNQFKSHFPALGSYHGDAPGRERKGEPIFLDTRAYFRATASSVVKLRDYRMLREGEQRAGQRASDLPATVNFEIDPSGRFFSDDEAFILGISDPRGNCRAVGGDHVVLSFPEELMYARERPEGAPEPEATWSFVVKDPGDSATTILPARQATKHRILKRVIHEVYRRADRIRIRIGSEPQRPGEAVPKEKIVELGKSKDDVPFRAGRDRPVFEIDPPKAGTGAGEEIILKVHGMPGGMPRSVGVTAVFDAKVRTAERRPVTSGRAPLDFLVAVPAMVRWQRDLSAEAASGAGGDRAGADEFARAVRDSLDGAHLSLDRSLALEREHLADDEMLAYVINSGLHPQAGDFLILEGRPEKTKEEAGPRGPAGPEDEDATRAGSQPEPLESFLAPAGGEGGEAVPATRLRDAHVIDADSLRALIAERRWPPERLSLKVVHDRGIFRVARATGEPGPYRLDLARGGRVRRGDRLILRWRSGKGHKVGYYGLAEVIGVDPEVRPPLGFRGVALRPWGEHWDLFPEDAGAPRDDVWGTWEIVKSLNNLEILEAWKDRTRPWWPATSGKPPLVIVTVSGGGIRASVWTATVLEALERRLGPRFPHQVRLITGASGGMVAAAYYATGIEEPGDGPPADRTRGGEASLYRRLKPLAEDQLNSVAACMVFNDLPGMMNPLFRSMDRGQKLEETWTRLTGGAASPLDRPLREFASDERAGWRPSLAFTPMLVEDGRRLLISNLDLGFVTRNYGRMLHEWGSSQLDPSYLQDLKPFSRLDDELFSLSALEFYRLFPAAWDVKVTTAIRMSASFPWIAPAVSLPTTPPRRVVDAGYYDNYGINLAAQWLTEFRHWLAENTSGVLVIQIRDGISQKARTEIGFDRPTESGVADMTWLDRLTWRAGRELLEPGLQPFTTPLRGVSAARQWSMSFRNDEQIELLDRLLDEIRPGSPDFFRTVVFECPVEASVSWKLTEEEKNRIRAGMGDDPAAMETNPSLARQALRNFREKDEAEMQALDYARSVEKSLSQEQYLIERKRLFDDELAKIGYANHELRTNRESEELYNNVMDNIRRLDLVRSWWDARAK